MANDISKITIGGSTYDIKDATARAAIATLNDPSTRYVLANSSTTTPTGALFVKTLSDGTSTAEEGTLIASADTYGPIYLVRSSEYNESTYQEWITVRINEWFRSTEINIKNYVGTKGELNSKFSTSIYVPVTVFNNSGFIFKIHRNGATVDGETTTITTANLIKYQYSNITYNNATELVTFDDVYVEDFLKFVYETTGVDVPTLSDGDNFTLHIEVGQQNGDNIFVWEMLGSSTGANVDNLGDFAYANSGYFDYTPEGSVTSTFAGKSDTASVKGTIPQKSLSMNSLSVGGMGVTITSSKANTATSATYTPEGTVSAPTITMNPSTVTITPTGTVSTPTFNGKYIYAKSSTISISSSGTASVSVPTSATVKSVTVNTSSVSNVATNFSQGTLPSLSSSYNANSETLVLSFSAGTLPSATAKSITVPTGTGSASVSLNNEDKSITLNVSGNTTYQPALALSENSISNGTQLQGTITQPIFTGTAGSGTFTPTVASVSNPSFTGTSVNFTGKAADKSVTPSGSVTIGAVDTLGLSVSYTPSGTVTSTFNGSPDNINVYPNK